MQAGSWFKVAMMADDSDEAVVFLNDTEYAAVRNFLSQIKEQRCEYSWAGGHWAISEPCATKEEAEKISWSALAMSDQME